VTGQWFSLGTLVSSTIKTGRQDITDIGLKVVLKHNKPNHQSYRLANEHDDI